MDNMEEEIIYADEEEVTYFQSITGEIFLNKISRLLK